MDTFPPSDNSIASTSDPIPLSNLFAEGEASEWNPFAVEGQVPAQILKSRSGLIKLIDPASTETIIDPNADEWKEAIRDGYATHILNQSWDIVDHPSSRKPIGRRFVLKTKFKENGDIERRKAWLVARVCTNTRGKLSRNFCSCQQNEFRSDVDGPQSRMEPHSSSDGCCHHVFEWWSWRTIHGNSRKNWRFVAGNY